MTTRVAKITADRAPVHEWFDALRSESKIMTDGATRVVDDLVTAEFLVEFSLQAGFGRLAFFQASAEFPITAIVETEND